MPLKYNQITEILKDFDFVLIRSKGSHFRYEKNGLGLTIGFHKEYPSKTAKSMLKDISKISEIDYDELIKKYNIKI